jgi:H2-forming N5,N10-methylenetetrahydromethanopterin dehydrogenase-like enzyme
MKTILLTLATITALSSAASAERTYDLRDSDTYVGSYSNMQIQDQVDVKALADDAATNTQVFFGKYGTTMDPAEARRWDEKNGG